MIAPTLSGFSRVLVLKSDRVTAAWIAGVAQAVWPGVEITTVGRVAQAAALLAAAEHDLLITGLGMIDGDTCGLVREFVQTPQRPRRILAVTGRSDPRSLMLVKALPFDGAFDSEREELDRLATALRAVAGGEKYFSEKFLCFPWDGPARARDVFRLLTDAEVLILAVLGEGCDRKTAALRLELSLHTIHSACRELHRKLGVHHDRELMCVAEESGLVRKGPGGIERPGFELLVERYEAAQKVKRPRPAFVAALCARSVAIRRAGDTPVL